uniref:Uncharacterized protein n=1 Tax=Megaselia scalaris TaxID=36166 RepID=T1GET0_MEGSC
MKKEISYITGCIPQSQSRINFVKTISIAQYVARFHANNVADVDIGHFHYHFKQHVATPLIVGKELECCHLFEEFSGTCFSVIFLNSYKPPTTTRTYLKAFHEEDFIGGSHIFTCTSPRKHLALDPKILKGKCNIFPNKQVTQTYGQR